MDSKVISKQLSKSGIVEYHVLGLDDKDFFDTLLSFIKQEFGAILLNLDEGIYTKKAYLNINNISLILEHHDDIGNCFYSTDLKSKEILEKIVIELESRLHDYPYE
ncbi:hypothetical protein [Acinetobacter zhairhuonensis]|uniref:hypothetical protein n=1 Tax=Acinetobacter sp. A7.4 TaxID=2919921 RepID=UPI001F4E4581|nr:hypothetical protein [Acinetobacter sp. A7.4]MCJ8160486.1 hypothetical protein [Acinetobacter sp. A7.4]